jgi:hypothetical protein
VSKTFRQPQLFYVVARKGEKWVAISRKPVPRPEAVRLVATAWRNRWLARIRPAANAKAA